MSKENNKVITFDARDLEDTQIGMEYIDVPMDEVHTDCVLSEEVIWSLYDWTEVIEENEKWMEEDEQDEDETESIVEQILDLENTFLAYKVRGGTIYITIEDYSTWSKRAKRCS